MKTASKIVTDIRNAQLDQVQGWRLLTVLHNFSNSTVRRVAHEFGVPTLGASKSQYIKAIAAKIGF